METAEEILLRIIPNGCINLKNYQEEKAKIIEAMEEYSKQKSLFYRIKNWLTKATPWYNGINSER